MLCREGREGPALGQLKSTLYARMEEVSFRSGAAVAGGVLTAAGVAITLAVVLGGHSDAVASAPASRVAIPSVVPPVLAPVSSSPPATPPATSRASRTTAPATVARTYQPPSAARAAATLHAAPPGHVVTPRRLVPRAPQPPRWPGWRSWHRSWPWRWSLSRHHRR